MTSKRWLRMFGIRTAKIVFALSLLLSCLTYGAGDTASQLRELQGKPPEQQLRLLQKWSDHGQLDAGLSSKLEEISGQMKAWESGPRSGAKAHQAWLAKQM